MQVPTNAFYDRGARAMSTLSAKTDLLQTQISTGKKLSVASQDAAGYQRLALLKRDNADASAYDANLTIAGGVLSSADSTLGSIIGELQRASTLALQARNGTQTDATRTIMATELDSIIDSLVALGNSRDARGQSLFGGADGTPAITTDAAGGYVLAAVAPGAVPIGDGQSVQPSETAARIFASGSSDILTQLTTLSAALKAGAGGEKAAETAIDQIADATGQVTTLQASIGARAARVDLIQAQQNTATIDREAIRSSIEDTDPTTAVVELQKMMTILSATQASFSKLSGLSLFDYLK